VEVDPDSGTVRVDWHLYAPDQVETWADRVLEAAWKHGFERVEFVHGASDVVARGTPGYVGGRIEGRGRIKALLRRRLYRGQWRRWALEVREGRHQIDEARMVIALRANPKPDRNARWPLVPPPAHG
jgi:hypothetical protein